MFRFVLVFLNLDSLILGFHLFVEHTLSYAVTLKIKEETPSIITVAIKHCQCCKQHYMLPKGNLFAEF